MRGPQPKDPAIRRRRNRAATEATLPAEPRAGTPTLPRRRDATGQFADWHELTRQWWVDVWTSPMAGKFLDVDVHGLYVLAELLDRFWREPSTTLASEIRQHRTAFGLTPIDRRRLQWNIQPEPKEEKRPKGGSDKRGPKGGDPRALLRVVS